MWPALVFLILVITSSPVFAAEVRHAESPLCALKLTGEIISGDYELFSSAAKRAGVGSYTVGEDVDVEKNHSLCLDSSGGSFIEGNKIAKYVWEHGIVTRISHNSHCLSACALIFMAGRSLATENDYSHRTMHIQSKLGFHAPYLALNDKQKIGDLTQAFALANETVALLISFNSFRSEFSSEPMIKNSLLSDMLRTDRNNFVFVDTVEKAVRWGIELDGALQPTHITRKMIAQACVNFQKWKRDETSDEIKDKDLPMLFSQKSHYDKEGFLRIDTGGMEDQFCDVRVGDKYFEICVRDDFTNTHYGICPNRPLNISLFYGMPPRTLLSDLK